VSTDDPAGSVESLGSQFSGAAQYVCALRSEADVKRPFTGALSAAAIVAVLSPSISAQWPLYPSGNVPKGPDGKPNLAAPAPRRADGKPDLSGIWISRADAEPNGPPAGRPPLATFGNAGAGFKDDLPFQPWAAQLQKKRAAAFSKDNPDGLCLPESLLQLHLDPQPLKIVQTPGQILIIYETNYGLRTIYMDGRPLPPQGEPQPYWYGYSVGRWEGDTLVVETNNYHSDGWLDARGSPMTDAAKVTERFRRVSYGQLDIEFTLDDPKAYTRPFTVRIDQQIVADGSELIEFICHENQQFLKRVKVE
jgi:hypothetical protein